MEHAPHDASRDRRRALDLASVVVSFYSPAPIGFAWVVAKIATLLARRGLQVLVVDWDARSPDLSAHLLEVSAWPLGLYELLTARQRGEDADWRRYLAPSKVPGLSLLPVGAPAEGWSFDWTWLQPERAGGAFLEQLRRECRERFDITLLHCPAADAPASRLCMVQLADVVALAFMAGEAEALEACQRVQQARRARQRLALKPRPLRVHPIPLTRSQSQGPWLDACAKALAPCWDEGPPKAAALREILERAQVCLSDEAANAPSYLYTAEQIASGLWNAISPHSPEAEAEAATAERPRDSRPPGFIALSWRNDQELLAELEGTLDGPVAAELEAQLLRAVSRCAPRRFAVVFQLSKVSEIDAAARPVLLRLQRQLGPLARRTLYVAARPNLQAIARELVDAAAQPNAGVAANDPG